MYVQGIKLKLNSSWRGPSCDGEWETLWPISWPCASRFLSSQLTLPFSSSSAALKHQSRLPLLTSNVSCVKDSVGELPSEKGAHTVVGVRSGCLVSDICEFVSAGLVNETSLKETAHPLHRHPASQLPSWPLKASVAISALVAWLKGALSLPPRQAQRHSS